MSDMPPVQFSIFAKSMQEELVKEREKHLIRLVDALYLELDGLIELCGIPPKETLVSLSNGNQIDWNPVEKFEKGEIQTDESFEEQKFAILLCKNAIDSYTDISMQTTLTKSIAIRGHPGAGKTFCMMFMIVYALTKGLVVTATAKMSRHSLQLGGSNWDKFLCLRGNEDRVGVHRRAELAIARIKRNRKKEDFLLSLNIIFADELGQLSAQELSLYDIILRHVRDSNSFMGGVLVIGTLDHLQIQPINGRPFLTANGIIADR